MVRPTPDPPSIRLRDLRNEDFVLFPKGFILHKMAFDACKQAGFMPNISSEGEDLDAIKGLVSAGIGVTLLPESTVSETTPRFTTKLPIHTPQLQRTVGMIIPRNRDLAPSDKIFYKFVKTFFERLEQYK